MGRLHDQETNSVGQKKLVRKYAQVSQTFKLVFYIRSGQGTPAFCGYIPITPDKVELFTTNFIVMFISYLSS